MPTWLPTPKEAFALSKVTPTTSQVVLLPNIRFWWILTVWNPPLEIRMIALNVQQILYYSTLQEQLSVPACRLTIPRYFLLFSNPQRDVRSILKLHQNTNAVERSTASQDSTSIQQKSIALLMVKPTTLTQQQKHPLNKIVRGRYMTQMP